MKTVKLIPIVVLMLMVNNLNAQSTGLEGSYLNIGTNTLIENNSDLWGNAMGVSNYVESANTLAVGNSDTIGENSVNAIVLGGLNKVRGIASMAFGNTVKINGNFSYGLGRYLKTNADYSIVIGHGIAGSGEDPDVFLENNHENSLKIGFNSTRATLSVSSSPNEYPSYGGHVNRTGKVAIGDVPIPNIAAKLHIRSDEGEDAGIILEPKDLENSSTFIQMRDEHHGIEVDEDGVMSINAGENPMSLLSTNITLSGKVGINTTNESDEYSLAVDGGILTNEVLIRDVDDWYDNVFAGDYHLLSLEELQQYINQYCHLPEMPSEIDVKSEGYKMVEMQGLLLKKIEELTLYTLKQHELLKRLQKRIDELEGK